MAQLNIYTYLSQITWTIIIFMLILYIMKKVILPTILENIVIKNLFLKNKSFSINYNTYNKILNNYSKSF